MPRYTPMCELPHDLPPLPDDPLGPIPKPAELAWQFEPGMYVDESKMGINARHIQRVARVGGLSGVLITGYQGETTSYDTSRITIAGIHADMSAAGAASGKVTQAPLAKASIQHEPGHEKLFVSNQWPRATVSLNRAEIANRVSSRITGGETQRRAWAKEIDAALGKGLMSAIQEAKDTDDWRSRAIGMLVSGYDLSMAVAGAAFAPFHPTEGAQALAASLALYSAYTGIKLYRNHLNFGNALLRRHRFSTLMAGADLDRVALAGLMCKVGRFAKPLGKE